MKIGQEMAPTTKFGNVLAKQALRHDHYPKYLKLYYGVNAKLKKDGIMAPQEASLLNTMKMYDALGKPLDTIPTLHVGGTNGKVFGSR